MLILIAESKTMTACDGSVTPECYRLHCPVFESEADDIMQSLRNVPAAELARQVRISQPLACRLQQMVYEFPNKVTGSVAMEAYTGVVFRAIGLASLSASERAALTARVRIVSSLYGWLRPDDIIKPYRFDYTTRLAPNGEAFASFWRRAVTGCIVREVSASGVRCVLNLLPADAARSVDWSEVGHHARLLRAEFKEITPTGARTPAANRLKTLRERFLRQIIRENITTADALAALVGQDYYAAFSDSDVVTFHSVGM